MTTGEPWWTLPSLLVFLSGVLVDNGKSHSFIFGLRDCFHGSEDFILTPTNNLCQLEGIIHSFHAAHFLGNVLHNPVNERSVLFHKGIHFHGKPQLICGYGSTPVVAQNAPCSIRGKSRSQSFPIRRRFGQEKSSSELAFCQ